MRGAVAVMAVVLLLTACGGDPDVPPGPGAAEPGRSPELVVDPAGTVTALAAQPEGMVYDARTGILAVAVREPNRLLLVDGRSGEIRVEVPLPGHARHLQLAGPGGPVLVPAEDSDTFVAVALPDGGVVQTPVGDYPHDAATVGDRTLVADERGGTLSVLDGEDVASTLQDVQQPGGVTAAGDLAAVVDVGAFTLSTYDLDAGRRVGVVDAGEGPTHLVADAQGRLVVADTRGDAVLVFTADPLALQTRFALPGTPYGVAWDAAAQTMWVTLTARNEVVALDLSGAEPVETARLPTVRQPNTVAVDPESGRVWVASRTTGDLQVIDP